jgi:hypothetical protein
LFTFSQNSDKIYLERKVAKSAIKWGFLKEREDKNVYGRISHSWNPIDHELLFTDAQFHG